MEFHVLSTKNCRVEQTETNFKLIKDSLHQLREDLHEAEIDFHRKPLETQSDDEDRDKSEKFSSSVSLLENCEHPWTEEEPEYADVNKAAVHYYNSRDKRKKHQQVDGPDLRRIKEKKIKQKLTPQQLFLKDLSKMWISGSNPSSLGPGTYDTSKKFTMKPSEPTRQSAAFNNRQCRSALIYMGDNNNSLRPRYDNVELDYSEDEVVTPSKLPPWKSFQSVQQSKPNTKAVFHATSEDAPVFNFPDAYPNKTSSSNFSFSHVPRFESTFRPTESKLRPQLGASGSCSNLGSTYRQSPVNNVVRSHQFATASRFPSARRRSDA